MTTAICGHPGGRELRLVVEDAAEVVAVGEDLGLKGQEGAARVDEVEARQPVLRRDLLRAEVLLHREREVRAALHGRVVRDDHARPPLDRADAGDDAGRRRRAVVHVPRGERAELEERAVRVDEQVDALAGGQLAPRAMALDRRVAAAARDRADRSRSSATSAVMLAWRRSNVSSRTTRVPSVAIEASLARPPAGVRRSAGDSLVCVIAADDIGADARPVPGRPGAGDGVGGRGPTSKGA